jgi:predicted nucleotidyltransferase
VRNESRQAINVGELNAEIGRTPDFGVKSMAMRSACVGKGALFAPCPRGRDNGGHAEPVIGRAEGGTRWLCPPYMLGAADAGKAVSNVWYGDAVKRDEAITRLKGHEAELKRLGVEHLYLFGSTARGEAKEDSDIDLFFDYEKGKFGVFELIDVKEYAASILGCPTDIMTRDSLHKALRRQIESTAVRVF